MATRNQAGAKWVLKARGAILNNPIPHGPLPEPLSRMPTDMAVDASPPVADIAEELKTAAALCNLAVRTQFVGLAEILPENPSHPAAWFDLLLGFPGDKTAMGRLRAMKAAAETRGGFPRGSFERFATLQAFQAALPRLSALPVDASAKWLFCETCAQVADAGERLTAHFDLDHPAFFQMAHLATLRWFAAGQWCFEFMRFAWWWLLKINPLDWPGLIRELALGFGGREPTIGTHLWAWWSNPHLILPRDYQDALLRIARTMALRPEIKGLTIEGWSYSASLGELFPRLAWLRQFFVERGAYLVDMGPVPPESGFLVGSAKRRQLYQEGQFRPRRTLILWRREAVLAWAASPGWPGSPMPQRPQTRPTEPARWGWRHRKAIIKPGSRMFVITEGLRRFLDARPRPYFLVTLFAPSAIAVIAAALAAGWLAAIPAGVLSFAALWILQYVLLFN